MIQIRSSFLAAGGALLLTAIFTLAASAASTPLPPPSESREETFASDPQPRGWLQSGDADLFHWNSSTESLEATWDSSRPNSYFYLPLPVTLTRQESFSLELDLTLNDLVAGIDPEKPGTFALAFGFFNLESSLAPNFLRSTGHNSPNLVEFNFFPDTGFGPTVWPAVWSTNSGMNYNGSTDYNLFDLPIGKTMRVELRYSSSNETTTLTITSEGSLVGPITQAPLNRSTNSLAKPFTDFRLNAVGIESYSDNGQDPRYGGSLLAHGRIDNLRVTTPAPLNPEIRFTGAIRSGLWRATVAGKQGWSYQLLRSSDLVRWSEVGGLVAGEDAPLELTDPDPPTAPVRFYRIVATRNP